MPLALRNVQWQNQNANRSYPLTDWATKRDQTGTVRVPDSFILGISLPIHAGLDVTPDRFFLHTLLVSPTGYNVAIGYDDEDVMPIVAAVNIARATHTENMVYAMAGVDDFSDTIGHIAIGKLDEIDQQPPGLYHFDPSGGAIEAHAVLPQIRGVMSLTCVNGNDRSEPLYGHIELIARDNMRIVANTFADRDPEIEFSAIEGEGLNEQCICAEEDTGPCIRTIDGIAPLPNGDFRLVGNACITITPIANGLQLDDSCSDPCCGCDYLNPIKAQIDRFADGAQTLTQFSSRLQAEVTQMALVVLGSRLGDTGCIQCDQG